MGVGWWGWAVPKRYVGYMGVLKLRNLSKKGLIVASRDGFDEVHVEIG
jgi:hypothetical protein